MRQEEKRWIENDSEEDERKGKESGSTLHFQTYHFCGFPRESSLWMVSFAQLLLILLHTDNWHVLERKELMSYVKAVAQVLF